MNQWAAPRQIHTSGRLRLRCSIENKWGISGAITNVNSPFAAINVQTFLFFPHRGVKKETRDILSFVYMCLIQGLFRWSPSTAENLFFQIISSQNAC